MIPRPRVVAALLLVVSAAACEPPLTEARRSLAIRTVFRDLTGPGAGDRARGSDPAACLRSRYLPPADSAFPSLLRTALHQRRVPLTDAPAPSRPGTAVVVVSPVRELHDALALDAAVGWTSLDDGRPRTEWTQWTYRLRCGVAECAVERRFGPRSSRLDAQPAGSAAPEAAGTDPCTTTDSAGPGPGRGTG